MVHYLEANLTPLRQGQLSFSYREALQGLIYNLLPEDLSKWLHNEGLPIAHGHWKPFVFSRLTGKMVPYAPNKTFRVNGPISFKFASPITEVVQELGRALMLADRVRIENLDFQHSELLLSKINPIESPAVVIARSPITVFRKVNGKRRYFRPEEPEFSEIIAQNLRNKAKALGKEADGQIAISPDFITHRHKKIERFHKMVVEGWMGRYLLEAPSEIIWIALTSGLGALGSQGFGFVEVTSDRRNH